MMKKIKNIIFVLVLLPLMGMNVNATELYQQDTSAQSPYTIDLSITPNPIGSTNDVQMYTTIDASANSLPDPTTIYFTVPMDIVRNSSEFKNQVMPSFLSYKSLTNDGTNYTVGYTLDRTTNIKSFSHFEFTVHFTSTVLYTDIVAESYPFTVSLGTETVSKIVDIKSGEPTYPRFAKYRKFAENADGYGLLDLNYPDYNHYELVFNRDNTHNYTNAIITDTLAEGTSLNEELPAQLSIPGDQMSIHGIRVYHEDSFGNRKYVTDEFVNNINYDTDTQTFSVDFGTVVAADGYVIEYAVVVTDPSLPLYTNTATLSSDELNTSRSTEEIIKTDGSGEGFFRKAVDKQQVNQFDSTLVYSFDLGGEGYSIPAGTVFYDYLAKEVTFNKITNDINGLIKLVSIEDNKVTFETTREIVTNETDKFSFSVDITENMDAEIYNTGYIILNNNTYYSNTVNTKKTIDTTLTIHKVDGDTGSSLSGASFQILDEDENEVAVVTTDKEGKIILNTLTPNIEYTIIETVAPTGYQQEQTAYTVTLDATNNYTITLTINNYANIPTTDNNSSTNNSSDNNDNRLPVTGQNLFVSLVGGLGIVMSAMFIIKRKK